jgi:hypothetical protein
MHNPRVDSAITPIFSIPTMGQTGYSSPTAAFPKSVVNMSKTNLSVVEETPSKQQALIYQPKPGTISK